MTIAGWRTVCRIERRAIWAIWPSVSITRAPPRGARRCPPRRRRRACGRSWRGTRRRASGACSWKSRIATSSASSARTTAASSSAPPLSRTAAASGGAGAALPKRDRTDSTVPRSPGSTGRDLERRAPDLGLELLRRAAGDDLAVVDDRDPVGQDVGLLEVLRGEEHRHALVARQVGDLLPHVRAAGGVQAGGRLVEEEDPRPVHERERQVQPALHAARVAADLAVGRVGEADALDQRVAARAALGLGHALQRGLELHVLAPGQQRVQRGLLQRGADRRADGRALAHDVVPRDPRRARGGRQQGGEDQDRGRLAGAVGAQEAVDLARLDAQVDAVDGARPVLELADEALHLDAVVSRHGERP